MSLEIKFAPCGVSVGAEIGYNYIKLKDKDISLNKIEFIPKTRLLLYFGNDYFFLHLNLGIGIGYNIYTGKDNNYSYEDYFSFNQFFAPGFTLGFSKISLYSKFRFSYSQRNFLFYAEELERLYSIIGGIMLNL